MCDKQGYRTVKSAEDLCNQALELCDKIKEGVSKRIADADKFNQIILLKKEYNQELVEVQKHLVNANHILNKIDKLQCEMYE